MSRIFTLYRSAHTHRALLRLALLAAALLALGLGGGAPECIPGGNTC